MKSVKRQLTRRKVSLNITPALFKGRRADWST